MGHRHIFQVFPVTVTFIIYQSDLYSRTFTGWKEDVFFSQLNWGFKKLESLYIDKLKVWFIKMNWNQFTDDQQ